jgi:hypothetical protein
MLFERFDVSRLFVDGDQSSHCDSPSVTNTPMTKRRQETDRGLQKFLGTHPNGWGLPG